MRSILATQGRREWGRGRVLAVIIGAGVVLEVVASLDPSTLRAGGWTVAFFVVVAISAVLVGVFWLWGDRLSEAVFGVVLMSLVVMILLTVMANQSRGGALLNLIVLLPPLLFAALQMSTPWFRVQEVVTLLACGGAMWVIAGSWVQWLSVTLLPVLGLIGAAEVVFLQRRSLDAAMQVLERTAVTDPLTGLLNRRGLEAGVSGRPPDKKFRVLLLIDIDHFKVINDTMGHTAGDAALRSLAEGLQATSHPEDLVARMGGEEFSVLTSSVGVNPEELADRVRTAAGEWLEPWSATVSIGVVHVDSADHALLDHHELVGVLDYADRCLYRAKDAGRNRVVSAPCC